MFSEIGATLLLRLRGKSGKKGGDHRAQSVHGQRREKAEYNIFRNLHREDSKREICPKKGVSRGRRWDKLGGGKEGGGGGGMRGCVRCVVGKGI